MEQIATKLRRTAKAAAASAELAKDDREARNRAIKEALDAGWKPHQIAAETGLDRTTIVRLQPELYR